MAAQQQKPTTQGLEILTHIPARLKKAVERLRSVVAAGDRAEGVSGLGFGYGSVHWYHETERLGPIDAKIFVYLVVSGTAQVSGVNPAVEYLPGQCLLSASVKKVAAHVDFLVGFEGHHSGLRLDFTVEEVVSVLLEMEVNVNTAALANSASDAAGEDAHLAFLELASRIADLSNRGQASKFLARHLKRELVYQIVMGPHGKSFVDDIIGISNSQDIFCTNDWIKSNYKSAFAVDKLARSLNMSLASFHRKFKAAIGMGPLQCQKQLRLVEARRLMLDEGHSVTDVALEVGYESMSQFSREYKRMFGLPPQRDIQELRAQTAQA